MLDILMKGVSTRQYAGVIGEMADTVGVSKSAISRDTIEAAERKSTNYSRAVSMTWTCW